MSKITDPSPAFGKPASKDDKLDSMLLTTKVVAESQSFLKKPVPIKVPIQKEDTEDDKSKFDAELNKDKKSDSI